eukprot:COSAG01_NODE_303_length_19167_cov_10.792454_14_plen_206_part_00
MTGTACRRGCCCTRHHRPHLPESGLQTANRSVPRTCSTSSRAPAPSRVTRDALYARGVGAPYPPLSSPFCAGPPLSLQPAAEWPIRTSSYSVRARTQSAVTVTSWLRRPAAAAAPHCRDSSCCCRSRSGGGGACKSTKGQEAAEKDPGASVGGVPTRARARAHTHNRRRSQLTRQRATSSRHRPAIGSEKGENCEVTRRQRAAGW